MLADPEFIKDAETRNMELVESSGYEELDAVISQTLGVDASVIALVKETLGLK